MRNRNFYVDAIWQLQRHGRLIGYGHPRVMANFNGNDTLFKALDGYSSLRGNELLSALGDLENGGHSSRYWSNIKYLLDFPVVSMIPEVLFYLRRPVELEFFKNTPAYQENLHMYHLAVLHMQAAMFEQDKIKHDIQTR